MSGRISHRLEWTFAEPRVRGVRSGRKDHRMTSRTMRAVGVTS
ncbi:hypothetical protein EV382_2844 [Micromonospora violae]|uniref:Uncharacterized protein n=1 Tax=Micromonospora violae TaxID=1278207 RepID=A0A4Q7UEH9_9ACTN|nr:hypothetical protein EV382_2844 [Micromonospora violae]